MTNEEIRSFFEEHAEPKFQKFTAGLIPDTDPKKIVKEDWRSYLANARDDSYEEIFLQGIVIGYAKADIEEILSYAKVFIPKIHDWSVNDGFCSTFKIAKKYPARVWDFLMQYTDSENEFEQRVVAVMLLNHYLEEEYINQVLAVWDGLTHEGYYRQMAVAWGLATAYAKFPEKVYAYLLSNHLDDFTYNKAIQKMIIFIQM